MEKIIGGHDKAPGLTALALLSALLNTLRDKGLLSLDDTNRLMEAAKFDLTSDRSEYRDALDILGKLRGGSKS